MDENCRWRKPLLRRQCAVVPCMLPAWGSNQCTNVCSHLRPDTESSSNCTGHSYKSASSHLCDCACCHNNNSRSRQLGKQFQFAVVGIASRCSAPPLLPGGVLGYDDAREKEKENKTPEKEQATETSGGNHATCRGATRCRACGGVCSPAANVVCDGSARDRGCPANHGCTTGHDVTTTVDDLCSGSSTHDFCAAARNHCCTTRDAIASSVVCSGTSKGNIRAGPASPNCRRSHANAVSRCCATRVPEHVTAWMFVIIVYL